MNEDIKILIIDDELSIRNLLRATLRNQGFVTEDAESGKAGIEKTTKFHPNLIVLDLGLPDMNGFEVLKHLRKWTMVPIVILTVEDDEAAKVKLLDAGADDYLTKPFSTPELLARIRVALRHRQDIEATPVFKSGNLVIDLNSGKIQVNEKSVKVSATEFELLRILIRSHGKVVQQTQLLKEIWGQTAVEQTHYLRIYIGHLRKKLEKDPSTPEHILTEPGVGYRIV